MEIYLAWGAAVGVFIAYVIIAICVFHFVKPTFRFRFHTFLFFALFLLLPITLFLLAPLPQGNLPDLASLNALGFYFFLVFGYLIFYGLLDRSLSVRINEQFHTSGNRPLSLEKIVASYGQEHSVERRFQIMMENGYLVLKDGRYVATAKGRWIAILATLAKRVFNIGIGG